MKFWSSVTIASFVCLTPVHAQWVKISSCASDGPRPLAIFEDRLVVTACGDSLRTFKLGGDVDLAARVQLMAPAFRALHADASRMYAASADRVSVLSKEGDLWNLEQTIDPVNSVAALMVEGHTLYRGTESGTIVVENMLTGRRFERHPPREKIPISGFAVSGDVLLVSTIGEGAFRSRDGGRKWSPVNNGMESKFLYSVHSGGGVFLAGAVNGSVVVSTNFGSEWSVADVGLPFTAVRALASYGENYFAGTWGRGVFLSTDAGRAWREANAGLPGGESYDVRTICVAGQAVWMATGDGLWRRSLWELCSPLKKSPGWSVPMYCPD